MFKRTYRLRAMLFAAASLGLLVGCGQSESPDSAAPSTHDAAHHAAGPADDLHDHPLTEEEIATLTQETADYEAAVERIEQYQQTIEQKTTAGNPAEAHRALDNLDVVLNRLPDAARDSGVPRAKWREVNETAQELQELFNQIHARIDAGEDPNYASLAEEIDRHIAALAAIEPEATE